MKPTGFAPDLTIRREAFFLDGKGVEPENQTDAKDPARGCRAKTGKETMAEIRHELADEMKDEMVDGSGMDQGLINDERKGVTKGLDPWMKSSTPASQNKHRLLW